MSAIRGASVFLCVLFPAAAAAGAVFFDTSAGRIPNWWNVLFCFFGIAARALASGAGGAAVAGVAGYAASGAAGGFLRGAAAALFAACAAGVFLFPLFLFRMTGAGDVKLLMACAAAAGIGGFGRILAGTVFAGGVLSAFLMASDGSFAERFRYFFSYVQRAVCSGRRQAYRISWRSTELSGVSGQEQESGRAHTPVADESALKPGEFHLTVPILMGVLLWSGGLL